MHSSVTVGDTAEAMRCFPRLHGRLSERDLTPGKYLTDGRNLFCVISQFVNGRSVLVWMEHCVTLEARARAARELEAMGMRAVANTGAQATPTRPSSPTPAGDRAAIRSVP
jgi:hypothetical protein